MSDQTKAGAPAPALPEANHKGFFLSADTPGQIPTTNAAYEAIARGIIQSHATEPEMLSALSGLVARVAQLTIRLNDMTAVANQYRNARIDAEAFADDAARRDIETNCPPVTDDFKAPTTIEENAKCWYDLAMGSPVMEELIDRAATYLDGRKLLERHPTVACLVRVNFPR